MTILEWLGFVLFVVFFALPMLWALGYIIMDIIQQALKKGPHGRSLPTPGQSHEGDA